MLRCGDLPYVEAPVRYDVHITYLPTGEMRVYKETYPFDREGLEFQYGEGNYSCDCNRQLFFDRAAGKPERNPHALCSPYNLYRVKILDSDGVTVYEDD